MAVNAELLRSLILCFAQEIARTPPEQSSSRKRGKRSKTKREILMEGLLAAAEMLNEMEERCSIQNSGSADPAVPGIMDRTAADGRGERSASALNAAMTRP